MPPITLPSSNPHLSAYGWQEWLEKQGLTLESRAHLITDAGQYVPGFSMFGPERVQFFIHSPFGWQRPPFSRKYLKGLVGAPGLERGTR
ncbi:hypothetical protein ABIE89_008512 [Bradyrhizobium niftali]